MWNQGFVVGGFSFAALAGILASLLSAEWLWIGILAGAVFGLVLWVIAYAAEIKLAAGLGINVLLLVAVTGFATWLFVALVRPYWESAVGYEDLEVHEITGPPAAGKVAERLLARSALLFSSSAADPFYNMPLPEIPFEVDRPAQDLVPLDSFSAKIGTLDLGPILKSLKSLVQSPTAILKGSLKPDLKELTLTLEHAGKSTKSWIIRDEAPPGPDSKSAANVSHLLDQAAAELAYYLMRRPGRSSEPLPEQIRDMSARVFAAYFRGRLYLNRYASTGRDIDLSSAEDQFRIVQAEEPDNIDALLYLGSVLTERRNEAEAVWMFRRAIRQLDKEAEKTDENTKSRYQARLYLATSLRKHFGWGENHQAVNGLTTLVRDLEKRLGIKNGEPVPRLEDARKPLARILAYSYIELAHALSHYLTYMRPWNIKKRFSDENIPEVFKINEKFKTARDKADKDQSSFVSVAQQIFELHETYLAKAKKLEAPLRDSSTIRRNEEANFESRFENAKGYAKLRLAQRTLDDDAAFKKAVDEALEHFNAANVARPNSYQVVQNVAVVYTEPRYDRSIWALEHARRLFSRSVKLKSQDYYSHESLAIIETLRAEVLGTHGTSDERLQQGLKHVEELAKLRGASLGEPNNVAHLTRRLWRKEKDASKRKAYKKTVDQAIQELKSFDRDDGVFYQVALIAWGVDELSAVDKEQYVAKREELVRFIELAMDEQQDWSWEWQAKRFLEWAKAVKTLLEEPAKDDRGELEAPSFWYFQPLSQSAAPQ